MNVLIGCEFSGVVRRAFRAGGHNAWSCDLLPAEDKSPYHLQMDVRAVLENAWAWDLMLAFPPCTYLCSSGLHWNARRPERAEKTEEALEFVRLLLDAPIERICLENPVGCISTRIRRPDQVIQPYQFGEDASKATCLWLKNLELLEPLPREQWVAPRIVDGKKRWANQTDSGQNKLTPSETRGADRSRTYAEIARAMACCWG